MNVPPQPWPPAPAPRNRFQWGTALHAFTAVMSVAALALATAAFFRSTSNPTYSAAEQTAAQEKFCKQYLLAARAASFETSREDNVALARISQTNGALILQDAASDPALPSEFREVALKYAVDYYTLTALGSMGDHDAYKAVLDDSIVQDDKMITLCGE